MQAAQPIPANAGDGRKQGKGTNHKYGVLDPHQLVTAEDEKRARTANAGC